MTPPLVSKFMSRDIKHIVDCLRITDVGYETNGFGKRDCIGERLREGPALSWKFKDTILAILVRAEIGRKIIQRFLRCL